ncbi:hypothetical protein BV325_05000 [Pseudomonas syringae pv. actinidiae]|nr:hypothetical protein BV325_05000 [Pseudomonas syringae pv. actinidiae]OSR68356.1 hypothetical protein BV328_04969 [Pseudomonas syringae pv. actinidiae]
MGKLFRKQHTSGPWFARSVIRENKAVMFDQVAGTQNLHTVYRDPSGRELAFNSLPSSYLESYLDARDAIVKNYA